MGHPLRRRCERRDDADDTSGRQFTLGELAQPNDPYHRGSVILRNTGGSRSRSLRRPFVRRSKSIRMEPMTSVHRSFDFKSLQRFVSIANSRDKRVSPPNLIPKDTRSLENCCAALWAADTVLVQNVRGESLGSPQSRVHEGNSGGGPTHVGSSRSSYRAAVHSFRACIASHGTGRNQDRCPTRASQSIPWPSDCPTNPSGGGEDPGTEWFAFAGGVWKAPRGGLRQ